SVRIMVVRVPGTTFSNRQLSELAISFDNLLRRCGSTHGMTNRSSCTGVTNVRNWSADPSLVALDWPDKLSGTPWLRAKGGDAMDFFRPRFTGIVIVARVTLLRGKLHEDERTREPKP